MKFLQVEQNTDAWLELRRTKIGASDAPIIMGCGYKKPSHLMEEKLTGKENYTTAAMQRGKDLEPVARELISVKHGAQYKPVVVQNSSIDWQIASLDGFDDATEYFIEIKCPNAEKYAKIVAGEVPIEYFWQIQHQLCVTDQRQASLFAFDGSNLVETIIKKDESAISELIHAENEFHQKMINFELPDDPIEERKDAEFLEALNSYITIDKAYKEAEELREICRQGLSYLCNERPARAKGYTVKKIFQKGKIDYSKVPELTGVDLDPYRKEGYAYWKVTGPRI